MIVTKKIIKKHLKISQNYAILNASKFKFFTLIYLNKK